MNNLVLSITELSALYSKLNSPESKIPEADKTAASYSFTKIISYLKKLNQIGMGGTQRTTENVPDVEDINAVINTGLITNQNFVNSLCEVFRIQNPPRLSLQVNTEETTEEIV